MTPQRILKLNAFATAACAAGMLATRGALHPHFGLGTPLLLDVIAVGLLATPAHSSSLRGERSSIGRHS